MDYCGRLPLSLSLCVFDLDGTLIDSLDDMAASVRFMLAHFGLPSIPAGDVALAVGNGAENLVWRCLCSSVLSTHANLPEQARAIAGVLTDEQGSTRSLSLKEARSRSPAVGSLVAQALAVYRAHYSEHASDRTDFYPGIRDWLVELSGRGVKLAVLSNKPQAASRSILAALGAEHFFTAVYGPESAGALKPDPAGLEVLMAMTGTPKVHTAMIGDSTIDIETGKRAGVYTCAVTGGFCPEEALRSSGADLLIERR